MFFISIENMICKDKIKDYKLVEGVTIRLVNESNKEIKKEEVPKPVTAPVKPIQPIKPIKPREIEEDKIQTALQFWYRIKKYLSQVENNTRDIGFYMGQSWNQEGRKGRAEVQIKFTGELDEDWKSIFKEATIIIEEAAPGIEFKSLELSKNKNQKNKQIIYKRFI